MGKIFVSSDALCPYYVGEDSNKVVCEGIYGATWHWWFRSSHRRVTHCKSYCRSWDFEKCPFVKIHESYD